MSASPPVLRIRDLTLDIHTRTRRKPILRGITLHVAANERVALVGESGSGKSVTARLVVGRLQEEFKVRLGGTIEVNGTEVSRDAAASRRMRGRDVAMVFQDPVASLNPSFTIGEQFLAVRCRRAPRIGRRDALREAALALAEVRLDDTERVLRSYPFQLSGGMNQRVMIAMALVNRPALLLADEPGTALDVTVQAQTLKLMRDLGREHDTAILLISHNLGVVREFADRVYVIHRGRIVERGRTEQVFAAPGHPYARALMRAVPRITNSDLSDLPEESAELDAPIFVHPGCDE